jgi:hypothetical protein
LFNLTIGQKFALAGIVVVVVGYFFSSRQRFSGTFTGILTMTVARPGSHGFLCFI